MRADGVTMQINKYDKRFLIMWAVFLSLAALGWLLKGLGLVE